MRGFNVIIMFVAVVAFPGAGLSSNQFRPSHDGMECTTCHLSDPIWEVDTIETAPLVPGFDCLNCHEENPPPQQEGVLNYRELGPSEKVSKSDCSPYMDLIIVEDPAEPNSFDISWNWALPPGGTLVKIALWISCLSDGATHVCNLASYPCMTWSQCGSYDNVAECRELWCWNSPAEGTLYAGRFFLPPKLEPYTVLGYFVWTPTSCSGSGQAYECCAVTIDTDGTVAGIELINPSTVTSGETWPLTVSAVNSGGVVVADYTGTVSFSLDQGTPYVGGPPKRGNILPQTYSFVDGDKGTRIFDVTSYTAESVEIGVSDNTTMVSAAITIDPGEPDCVKRVQYEPFPIPTDPMSAGLVLPSLDLGEMDTSASQPNKNVRLLGGGGFSFVVVCPSVSVVPAYLPADGSSVAAIQVTGITDTYGNLVANGSVTVATNVGTIITFDSVPGPGAPGIQVPVLVGVADFDVQAGMTGVLGAVSVTNSSGTMSVQSPLTVVSVAVSPSVLGTIESLDRGVFNCQVMPSGLNPSFQWLTGASEGAWPVTSGNSPVLNYSAPNDSVTSLLATRWFAPTPSRRQLVDGLISTYSIGCRVSVGGTSFTALSPASLNVVVDLAGRTEQPRAINIGSIQIAETSGGIWYVLGKGSFRRSDPIPEVDVEVASQFYLKAMTHEDKHVIQWTSEAPWKDLFDMDSLYSDVIVSMTSALDSVDLRDKIFAVVMSANAADSTIAYATRCDRELAAFNAMNAVEPDFLELDEADWKPMPAYQCP